MSPTSGPNTSLRMLLILAAAVAIVMPLYFFGITNGNDLPQHYQFAMTFERSLQEGTIYPSWSADSNNGFGDIGIRFYPPLAYYVMVAAKFIGGNWYNASVITFAFWFFIGCVGIYFLAREWLSPNASLAAALLFLLMPYHTNQIYNAFLYAEFAATSVLPFCFLFAHRTCKRGSMYDIAGLSASYAVLIITHLPLTVIGSISLLVFSLASLQWPNTLKSLVKLTATVAIALAASSFYWLRMVSELSLVKHAHADLVEKAYDFRINFLLSYFNTPTADYLDRSLIFSDLMLLATLAVAVAGAAPFFLKRTDRKALLPFIALLAVSLFFATPLSMPLWERFEFLAQTQFPWRWLAVISIAATVLAASGFDIVVGYFRTDKRPVALIVTGVAAAVAAFTFAQIIRPAVYVERQQFENRVAALTRAKGCECFWPVTANPDALSEPEIALPAGRKADVVAYSTARREYSVSPGVAGEMRLPLFYYPHWNASVNGNEQTPNTDPNGAVVIDIPAEAANVVIQFEEPQSYSAAAIISLVAWLALFAAGVMFLAGRLRKRPEAEASGLS